MNLNLIPLALAFCWGVLVTIGCVVAVRGFRRGTAPRLPRAHCSRMARRANRFSRLNPRLLCP